MMVTEDVRILQLFICILWSNSLVFLSPHVKGVEPESLAIALSSPLSPPPPPPPVYVPPVVVGNETPHPPREFAEKGNGKNEDLSSDEIAKCHQVFQAVQQDKKYQDHPEMKDYIHLETCRRYLVARGWNVAKALAQLQVTVAWYAVQEPWKLQFHTSPPCVRDPYALTFRIVGLDDMGRPILFTSFLHALHRNNPDDNILHFEHLMESARRLLHARFQSEKNVTAKQLQWVLVIFFPGFGFQDLSVRGNVDTAKMMTYFPEYLGLAVLVDAPLLFSSAWKLINGVLDDRVRAKVAFCSQKSFAESMPRQLGQRMTSWLSAEMTQCVEHKGGKRAYWKQYGAHDARGEASYVHSSEYVKTPGDVFDETTPI